MAKIKKNTSKKNTSKKKVPNSQPPSLQKRGCLTIKIPVLSLRQKRAELRRELESQLKGFHLGMVPPIKMKKICEEVIPNNKVLTDGVHLFARQREAGAKIVEEVFLEKYPVTTIRTYVEAMVQSPTPLVHFKEMCDRRQEVCDTVREKMAHDTLLRARMDTHGIVVTKGFFARCIVYLSFVMYDTLCKKTGIKLIGKQVMKNLVKEVLAPPLLKYYYSVCTPFFNEAERQIMIEAFMSTMLNSKQCAIELLQNEIQSLEKHERNSKDLFDTIEDFGFFPLPQCTEEDGELR